MTRTSLGVPAALAIAAMMGAAALLAQPVVVEAQSHSASRAFQQTWASPGSELQVTITASNYGAFGQVVETLPDGFTFVGSNLPDDQEEVEGQIIRFNLIGDSVFNYVVTVPTTEGQYTFSGVIRNVDREEQTIAGQSQLRVGPPPTPAPTSRPTPEPTATPTPQPTATPTPKPTATPTPQPTATPTPQPTATPTPQPTVTPTPQPTATSMLQPTATPTPEPTATPMPRPTATPRRVPLASPPGADESGGVPGWVILLGVAIIAAGVIAWIAWWRSGRSRR